MGSLPAPPAAGTCSSDSLQVGYQLPWGLYVDPLHQWQIASGRFSFTDHSSDADPDLAFVEPRDEVTGRAANLIAVGGDDPFLPDRPWLGQALEFSGPRLVLRELRPRRGRVRRAGDWRPGRAADGPGVLERRRLGKRQRLLEPPQGVDSTGFGTDLTGDFDGDGVDDLMVASDAGLHLFSTTAGKAWDHRPVSDSELKGDLTTLSGVGDADGDGRADLAYGDVDGDLVRWDGSPDGFSQFWADGTVQPTAAGDVYADGYEDLLVVARDASDAATVWLMLGGLGTDAWNVAAWELKLGPTASIPQVVGLGDLDGDGYGEIALQTVDSADGYGGRLDLFGGTADGVDPSPWFTCAGAPGEELGMGLANLGDMDGDGTDELLASRIQQGEYDNTVLKIDSRTPPR